MRGTSSLRGCGRLIQVGVAAVALSSWATAHAEDGVTDTEIVLGSSAAYHGPSAGLGVEQWRGFMAYFDRVNAAGGVFGRKIRVIAYDDNYEPLYCVPNTQKLLEQDKVFALFGYVGTPTLVKALPVLAKFADKNAFLFTNFTGAQPQRDPPFGAQVFNLRASYREETEGLVNYLSKLGSKRFGAYIQDDAYGKSGLDGIQRAVKARAAEGVELVATSTYDRGLVFADKVDAQVKEQMAAKVEAVIMIGAYQGCAAFMRDMRLAGFEGPMANVSFVGAGSLIKQLTDYEKSSGKKITKNVVNSQTMPNCDDSKVPICKEYLADMKKIGLKRVPNVPPARGEPTTRPTNEKGFVSMEGYADAKLLVEMLKRTGKDLTRVNFKTAAESAEKVDIGLGKPLGFSPTNHQASHHVWYTMIKNGKWASINDWEADFAGKPSTGTMKMNEGEEMGGKVAAASKKRRQLKKKKPAEGTPAPGEAAKPEEKAPPAK